MKLEQDELINSTDPSCVQSPEEESQSAENVIHNKPKRSNTISILKEDYKCAEYELRVLEPIMTTPSNGEEQLVYYPGIAGINRKLLDCLFKKCGKEAYLNDEVMNAYIGLINAQKNLIHRTDGSVIIENTFISEILKRDGSNNEEVMDDFYPKIDKVNIKAMEKRVSTYLQTDMIFLPINIRDTHWYLGVINAKKRQIQILDSSGPTFDRTHLKDSLKGLQRQINRVGKYKEINSSKWSDLQVAEWPLEEIDLGISIQTDDCSCGLFTLNNAEYWTGEELSDAFTQEDMTNFRLKLASILLTSELNKASWLPPTEQHDDGSTSDIQIVESVEKGFTPKDSYKRKRTPSPFKNSNEGGLPEEINNKKQENLESDLTNEFWEGFFKEIDEEETQAIAQIKPNKEEMINELCNKIMQITHLATLETMWVLNFHPYQIKLFLKDLTNSLSFDQPMTTDIFNMGVRMVAHKNNQKAKLVQEKPNHYMELDFNSECDFWRPPIIRKKLNVEKMTNTFRCLPHMNSSISTCKSIFIPLNCYGNYYLIIIQHEDRNIFMFDPTPIPDWSKKHDYQRLSHKFNLVFPLYEQAAQELQESPFRSWVFWNTETLDKEMNTRNREISGHQVLSVISIWNGKDETVKVSENGQLLRREFLVELLAFEGNEARSFLPEDIKSYLSSITEKKI